MAYYDTSGQVGMALADREYFNKMKDLESEEKGKKSSRKFGMASTKGLQMYSKSMGPSKLTVGGESIFKSSPPSGNWLERVGQKLTGPDLRTVELTKEAGEAGYSLGTGKYNVLGKIKEAKTLEKGGETVAKQFGKPGVGGLSTKVGGLLGAYQLGTGLTTAFDPHASVKRKVGGVTSAALGANALLALGGANVWNPVGWGALAVGAGAAALDYFG